MMEECPCKHCAKTRTIKLQLDIAIKILAGMEIFNDSPSHVAINEIKGYLGCVPVDNSLSEWDKFSIEFSLKRGKKNG